MSETFEISDTSTARPAVSENGKKCYYLNVQQSPPADRYNVTPKVEPPESPLKMFNLFESGPLIYEEAVGAPTEEVTSGPLHYGETMVVKNAREMFNNVDILADGRYYCCVCNRPYKTHATLTAHLRGSHLRQESPCLEIGCNHVSYTENERKKHQKMHDKKKYTNISRESLQMHHKMEESVNRMDSPSENVLREEVLRNSKEIPGMVITMDKRGKEKYTCAQCKQLFYNVYHATRHLEVHSHSPVKCFYCGEIRNGKMDLHVHYMRIHKNEGIRTITCKACECAFTTTTLFQNHANQKECELACQNLAIRYDVYYGELPAGTTIDHVTLNRLNFFRKRLNERETLKQMVTETGTEIGGTVQLGSLSDEAAAGTSTHYSDIFDGSHSLIQTEFGLKNLAEFKTASELRARSTKRAFDDSDDQMNAKRERVLMAQNGYYHDPHPTTTQSQQQNVNYAAHYIHPPPTYGYDPLIGSYPDFQPMQQSQYVPYDPFAPALYENPGCSDMPVIERMTNGDNEGTANIASYPPAQDPLGNVSDIASELMVNQEQDVVFEELNKLDFVMPSDNNNDNDDDLEEMFNF